MMKRSSDKDKFLSKYIKMCATNTIVFFSDNSHGSYRTVGPIPGNNICKYVYMKEENALGLSFYLQKQRYLNSNVQQQ